MRGASPEHSRGSKCGYGAGMHRASMKLWIAQNLERYGPITPNHVFHVTALWTEYAVRRDDLGANLGYRPIARIKDDNWL
jgi:hypothetical protein